MMSNNVNHCQSLSNIIMYFQKFSDIGKYVFIVVLRVFLVGFTGFTGFSRVLRHVLWSFQGGQSFKKLFKVFHRLFYGKEISSMFQKCVLDIS